MSGPPYYPSQTKRTVLSVLNALTLAAVIAVNGLANALPFNNQTTGAISDRFTVLFKPAGYAFSIWGLIYLALIGFVIYQLLPAQRKSALIDKIGPYFILNGLANMGWLLAWHHEQFWLSVGLMGVLLGTLLKIYLNLNLNRAEGSTAMRLAVFFPFSLYLGWITVATLANVTIALEAAGWNGLGLPDVAWYSVVLLLGLLVAAWMVLQRRDLVFGGVVLWAYIAVAVQNTGSAATLAWGAGVGVAAVLLWGLWQQRHS